MGMILGGEITSALTTFAGLGLALILEGDGAEHVRLGWTDAAEPRMVVTADGYEILTLRSDDTLPRTSA